MTKAERIFFRAVCDCKLHGGQVARTVELYTHAAQGWTRDRLLMYLEEWAFKGFYNFAGRIDDGWLEPDKMPAEYLRVWRAAMMEV